MKAQTVLLVLFTVSVAFGSLCGRGEAADGSTDIRITAGGQELTATLPDSATARDFVARLPLTVPMRDLYAREMCYHFADALPAPDARTGGYEAGDIGYWVPGRSLVIFYKQNGEIISGLQHIGHIASGVELFERTGDTDVTFELLDR